MRISPENFLRADACKSFAIEPEQYLAQSSAEHEVPSAHSTEDAPHAHPERQCKGASCVKNGKISSATT